MRQHRLAARIFFLAIVAQGCVDKDATARLEAEIKQAETSISESRAELGRFKEGSPLGSLIQARLAVQQQTVEMLRQKRGAALYYPRFSYVVDGKAYEAPTDLEDRIKRLEETKASTEARVKAAEERAKASGLLASIAAATEASTLRIALAQIEYQRVAYQSGFPPLIGYDPAAAHSTTAGTMPAQESSASAPVAPAPPAPASDPDLETMSRTLAVDLKAKTYYPQDFAARRYKATLGLKFEYGNRSERDIRAFTGTVVFRDIFDRDVLRVSLTADSPLAAGATIIDADKSLDINEFNDAHKKIVNSEIENLRVSFEPQSILFSDGSRLGTVKP